MRDGKILRSSISPPIVWFNSVGEMVWNKLLKLKDNSICLIDPRTDQRLTILELKTQANSIAVALIERGISKTDRIAFYGQNSIQHVILKFVTYFLGLTQMPLSPTFERYEVEQEVRGSEINVIFSSANDLHKFDNVLNNKSNNIKLIVVFDGKHDKYLTFEQLLEEGRDETLDRIPYFDVNPETDMFLLIHTSGSTGHPKCAMLSHRAILHTITDLDNFISLIRANVKNPPVTISGFTLPLGHIGPNILIPFQLIIGTIIILFNEFDENFLIESIDKYRITYLPTFPHFIGNLIENDRINQYDISSLTSVSSIGSALPGHMAKAIIEKFNVFIGEGYGMTEYFSITTTVFKRNEFIANNLGPVSPGTELKIVDLNTGESLGPNIDGEICVRGNKIFSGYLNDEKAYKEAFDKNGWFRTGDIGHYDECERIFVTDRLKEVIRIGVDDHLLNISPVEIEDYLLSHKSISEVAVVGVNDRRGTQWPRAFVVTKPGSNLTKSEIQKFIADTLAYTKQLKGGVVFVDQIQRTSIFKVDRKYYRNLVKNEII